MTLDTQLRWLRAEQRRCEQWLAEGIRSGHGTSVLAKAREDLAALTALRTTLEGRQLRLLQEKGRYG